VEKTQPDAEVVAVIGDYSFQLLVEELAVAAQYDVPFVLIMLIMLINEYLGLIRQAERGYAMNYQVDLHYDPHGTDIVKIMTAYGCTGTRVVEPAVVDPVGAQGGRAHQQTGARGNHDRAHRKRRHGHFAG
jgi:tartronate-semialdehyde synthase